MNVCYVLLVLFAITRPVSSAEHRLDEWVFPGAQFKEKGSPFRESKYPNGQKIEEWRGGFGQYVADAPFHEVLAFYVEKSGLNPPNRSIVGREFPGTRVFIPTHFVRTGEFGEGSSVTLLHFIREEAATGVFSIAGHPELGSLTIVVSRGKEEDHTVIQMISSKHPMVRSAEEDESPGDEDER